MATAEQLDEIGALSTSQLYQEVSDITGIHVETVRMRLQRILDQFKTDMIRSKLVEKPDGWVVRCKWHRFFVLYCVAYLAATRRMKRLGAFGKAQLFDDLLAGEHYAVDLLPISVRMEVRRKPGPTPRQNVTSIAKARRRRAS